MSSDHQDQHLALKSASITIKEDLTILTWFNNLSKVTKNFSNLVLDWLGDLNMTVMYNHWLKNCFDQLLNLNMLQLGILNHKQTANNHSIKTNKTESP